MKFDFERFRNILRLVYADDLTSYPFDEVNNVFFQYFSAYEDHTGRPHPPIRAEQIRKIVGRMDSWDDDFSRTMDVEPYQYEYLIPQHFKTKYRRCDYNINHFFSGRIREMRYYDYLGEPEEE